MERLSVLMLCWITLAIAAKSTRAAFLTLEDSSWLEFKQKHGKQYSDSVEEAYRRLLWKNAVELIEKHNSETKLGHHSFTMAVNQFSDLTADEYKSLLGYRKSSSGKTRRLTTTLGDQTSKLLEYISRDIKSPPSGSIPKAVDWRLHGYVTPVESQGLCGACWAFAATGSLEGQHFKKTGELVPLSEQNLVDCVHEHPYGVQDDGDETQEFGCQGAEPADAFYYIAKNGGIDQERNYTYEGKERKCRFNKKTIGAQSSGFVELPAGDEDILKQAVALIGPIAAAMDADHLSFKLYQQGIYTNWLCDSDDLNHAVLIVGYGTNADGDDYWLVKNSWGPTWGMNGYAMLPRNRRNYCGIATDTSFPTVD